MILTMLMKGIGGHQERLGALAHHCSEGAVEFIGATHRDGQQRHAQYLYGNFQLCELRRVGGIIRIPEKGNARERGNNFLEELQPFPS